MTRPARTDEERAAWDAIYKTWFLPWGFKPKSMKGLMARRRMYDEVTALNRRISAIHMSIWHVLRQQGVGANECSGRTLSEATDKLIKDWADAQDRIDAPAPQTLLDDLLDEHHRLLQAEYDLLDDIEKREGAVSPLYDSRPYSTPRPCPYPLPELVPDPKQPGKDPWS